MRVRAVLATTGLVGAAALAAAVPAQAQDTATVSVLHGVPGLTVDVYANNKELIPNFKPGTLAGPLKLPAGTYDIEIFPAGKGPDGKAAIEKSVQVPAGANATVVAHLTAGGQPTLTPFVNDTSAVGAGKARLTVRHVAAAPAVDVRAGGTPVVKGLTNPQSRSLAVDAGSVRADVVLAGTDTVAIGPATLNLGEGTSTIVYAWGSAKDDNLQLAVQTIRGLHSAPGGVPAGEAGLVADGNGSSGWGLAALGGIAVAGGAAAVAGRRRLASASTQR